MRPNEGLQPARCDGHLELRQVSFHYPTSSTAIVLSDVSIDAPPGSIVALVGASGAGKSTIARLIERFYDPSGGAVLLDGVDFRQLELRWLRRQIGFVEQVKRRRLDCHLIATDRILVAIAGADALRPLARGQRTVRRARGG